MYKCYILLQFKIAEMNNHDSDYSNLYVDVIEFRSGY